MSDTSQLPKTTPPAAEPATEDAGQPPKPGIDSGKTSAPLPTRDARREYPPGTGEAIFSTELGTRAPRPPPGPPYPPVIVRGSDPVKAVVDAAHVWQKKFKWQCLCIFPNQGWDINDLWDAEDLHLDSPGFCQKMLTFISRDTYYAAKQFAEDWLRAHPDPDRINFIASDTMSAYDPNHPSTTILEKIFVYGEMLSFPITFLSHVVYIMRLCLAEHDQARNTSMRAVGPEQSLHVNQQGILRVNFDKGRVVSAESDLPSQGVHKSLSTSASTTTSPPRLPVALNSSIVKNELVHGSSQSLHDNESASGYSGGKFRPLSKASDGLYQGMKPLKGKGRNMKSASYNHPLPSHGWAENINHPQPSPYNRHVSGTISNLQSPQFHPATVAIGQPMLMPPNAMQPFVHGLTMIAPGMPNAQFDPGVSPRGILPGHHLPTQAPIIGQAYLQQPPHSNHSRGLPIGDVTNTLYYPNNTPIPQIDPRGPPSRRTGNFHNNGVLFDPYGGANPKFRDATASNGGNKSAQYGFANHPGRLRKISASSNRSGHANHGSDRPTNSPFNRLQHFDPTLMKVQGENDPAITENHESGCNQFWIGPENTFVDEIFVGDLPEDVQESEVRHLFEQFGVSPNRIVIKSPREARDFTRWHAFVSFSSPDAKKAFRIRDHSPTIRNGSVAVSVTVPRRFFQKDLGTFRKNSMTSGSFNISSHANRLDERNYRSINRMSSCDEDNAGTNVGELTEKLIYSPQDARSDLHKKVPQQSDYNDSVLSGSPEAHKTKARYSSTTKEKTPRRGSPSKTSKIGTNDIKESAVVKNVITPISALPGHLVTERITNTLAEAAGDSDENPKPAIIDGTFASDPSPIMPKSTDNKVEMLEGSTRLPSPQQESLNAGHDSVNQPSGTELEPTVMTEYLREAMEANKLVDVPSPVEQTITKTEPAESEQSNENAALVCTMRPTEKEVPDEEEKKDDSFLSAKDSVAESSSAELQPLHGSESDLVNQGIVNPPTSATAESVSSEVIYSTQIQEEKHHSPKHQSLSTTAPEVQVADPEPENRTTSHLDGTSTTLEVTLTVPVSNIVSESELIGTMIKGVIPALIQGPGVMAPPLPSPGGAQRIESLSPFAKPSKTQQKKEKEAKKKQQKKAEAEKAKAASSSYAQATSSAKTNNQPAKSSKPAADNSDISTKATVTEGNSAVQVAQTNKGSKKKAKALNDSHVEQDKPIEFELTTEVCSQSESSSVTLQAEDDAATSPSTLNLGVSEIPQNPSMPVPPQIHAAEVDAHQTGTQQDGTLKKKKKKPKKKLKKATGISDEPSEPSKAADTSQTMKSGGSNGKKTSVSCPKALALTESEDGIDDDDGIRYDPLYSRMWHEDAVMRGLKDPESYWKRVKAEMAAEEEAKEASFPSHDGKGMSCTMKAENFKPTESTLKRQIEAYMRENRSLFPSEAKVLTPKDVN